MTQVPSRTAASRVRELRKRRGLSALRLAQELTKAGVAWERETVTQFESGQRERLDVEELFALSVVLSVPPVALVTDASRPTMALTPQVEVPTAYGLLWQLGEQPLHGMTGVWVEETVAVRLARQFHERMWRCVNAHRALETVEGWAADGRLDLRTAENRRNVQDGELADALTALSRIVAEMREHDVAVPRLVDQEKLVASARARGIPLDFQSDAGAPTTAADAASVGHRAAAQPHEARSDSPLRRKR